MLWDAMLKAAKGGMPLDEMRDKLKACGYELCTKRVLGSSENMFIENALAEYARLKSEGLCERQIDSEMQFDRRVLAAHEVHHALPRALVRPFETGVAGVDDQARFIGGKAFA